MLLPLRFASLMAAFAPLLSPSASAAGLGDFDGHADFGQPRIPGSALYQPATQEYLLEAGGTDIWFQADEGHFVWKKWQGDFIFRARAEFLAPGIHRYRKLGLMMRAGLEADAAYADLALHGNGITDLQWRRQKGELTKEAHLPVENADVLQLERRGTTLIFSAARSGDPLVAVTRTDLDLGADVYLGLFLCAHSDHTAERALFRDVRAIRPAKPDFKPYHDYIGCQLQVLDVFSGRLLSLFASNEPFEAPNWTHDGATLIYNVSGRGPNKGLLRRFDLASGKPEPLPTGNAIHNNNDHVLSFDGSMLAISNQGPETGNRSAVYVLPATGGQPRLLTPKTPSYMHGWSPDGRHILYTGGRPQPGSAALRFDIYRLDLEGGEETLLTRDLGQCDGSEYSPDGRYIYFNSTRSGRMQLWRMHPDGTQPEQLTNDEFNNWFPHLSPDGRWIAFVSYAEPIAADDHPYYKHVYLRLMPAEGGPARVIAYLYGGQGTMNVPSWSPDSRRIAFVSNSDSTPAESPPAAR